VYQKILLTSAPRTIFSETTDPVVGLKGCRAMQLSSLCLVLAIQTVLLTILVDLPCEALDAGLFRLERRLFLRAWPNVQRHAFLNKDNGLEGERPTLGNDMAFTTTPISPAISAPIGEYYPDFLPHPDPSLSAVDVVSACMNTFLDEQAEAGLEVCFHFSSDRCRAATGGSLSEFSSYAQNPTFQYLTTHCKSWQLVSVGPIIPGTPHRGSMQTVLIEVYNNRLASKESSNAALVSKTAPNNRRFLWTLQQERRPPLQGCWMIHEVLYTKNAWQQTL
jgi:hypothetical protein